MKSTEMVEDIANGSCVEEEVIYEADDGCDILVICKQNELLSVKDCNGGGSVVCSLTSWVGEMV